jgi:type IV pilus assembly protein PilY1
VDGEIAISDKAKTGNVNYLVGFLGQGGKGLFALDVTTPSTFGASNYKWANHGTSDADMGYLLGRPTIAKTKSGDNVVIFGNGYNSTNEKAVLYVYKLETGALLAKIDTGVGGSANSNGLSSPGLTYASDGTVEHVYAGDLKGNVWKFDLTNSSPSQWKSAFLSGSTPLPFFTATDSAGKAQPITAQVTIATNDVSTDANYGKRFILFGTGSYMSVDDAANLDIQSLYGLIDEGTRITGGRTVLTKRQVQNAGTYAGRVVRTFSSASTNDMANKSGWYLDWLTPPSNTKEGERVVSSARIYKTIKSVLIVSSIIPIDDPCVPGGRGYVNGLDPYTGAAVNDGIFNINGDTSFADDKLGSSFVGSFDLDVGLPGEPVVIGNRLVVGGSLAKISDVLLNMPTGAAFKGRISWREIVR